MSTMRRLKWHPPPPPSPRILYLPRRHRRKLSKNTAGRPIFGRDPPDPGRTLKGKLSTLFSEEQRTVIARRSVSIARLSSADMRKRGRVKEEEEGKEGEEEEEEVGGEIERGIQEEKWRFQAEILRAECNFLRAEREFALKKLGRNRVQLERTLGSAVQALIAGRKKIREGKSVGRLLEEEIEKLAKKLRELQGNAEAPDFRVRKCSNFDRQAFLLQKRLEKIGGVSDDDKCMKQIQKIAESSLSINACSTLDGELLPNRKPPDPSTDVEILRRKMEGLSKGMLLEKMEAELGSVLSTAIISPSATTSATLTPIDCSDSSSSSSIRPPSQESAGHEASTCEGQCKAVVRRVMEQVRAETEQWTQMQQILAQVREEMEDLEASRDFWEEQALHSNSQSQSLRSHLKDWRKRAVTSEAKASELQAQISVLHGELEKLRRDQSTEALKRVSRDAQQTEKEKRVLICQLKENDQVKKKGKGAFIEGRKKVQISSHALKDIANVSPLLLRHYKK